MRGKFKFLKEKNCGESQSENQGNQCGNVETAGKGVLVDYENHLFLDSWEEGGKEDRTYSGNILSFRGGFRFK